MDTPHDLIHSQARLLVTRLERLSADSLWARRASGCRGALLKLLEEVETPADPAGEVDWQRLAYLVDFGFSMLEKAAREMRGDEDQSLVNSER